MTTKIKKNRKMRGTISSGKGRVGKHRKHPSGRGKSGGQHHHKNIFSKKYPLYFGKKGMRFFYLNKNKYSSKIILLNTLTNIVKYKVHNNNSKLIHFSTSMTFLLSYVALKHIKKTKILKNKNCDVVCSVFIIKKYSRNIIENIIKAKNICFTPIN
uniref:Ribosomal protein L27a n=1 Tax=Lotharella vacuolata TaxID=74820 RepID=A0A0H5BJX6_9EUKA|nr:ribosomal protein L27a [Lotharella vacuolata]